MCIGSSPSIPAAPPPAPAPPTKASPEVVATDAGAMQRARAASAVQTVLTGPMGVTPAAAGGKTLLGA